MNNEQHQEILMYYVLMTDSNDKISVMGTPGTEDDAREHEEQLRNFLPDNPVWTCVESGALG
jgi:hypothetical protein